jgi:hypothetical protein
VAAGRIATDALRALRRVASVPAAGRTVASLVEHSPPRPDMHTPTVSPPIAEQPLASVDERRPVHVNARHDHGCPRGPHGSSFTPSMRFVFRASCLNVGHRAAHCRHGVFRVHAVVTRTSKPRRCAVGPAARRSPQAAVEQGHGVRAWLAHVPSGPQRNSPCPEAVEGALGAPVVRRRSPLRRWSLGKRRSRFEPPWPRPTNRCVRSSSMGRRLQARHHTDAVSGQSSRSKSWGVADIDVALNTALMPV